MENKIEMIEVSGAQDIQALVGCTIISVVDAGEGNDEGIFLDSKDAAGNRVCFVISEDGSWHFHNGRKKSVTAEQIGEISLLTECSDIDSVHFQNVDPLIEIVIKVIGTNAADRVLTILKMIFPMLVVSEDGWDFEGETQPLYQCSDPSYDVIIAVAVMA